MRSTSRGHLYLDPFSGSVFESDVNLDPENAYRLVGTWEDAQQALREGDFPLVVTPQILSLPPGERNLALEQVRVAQYESVNGQPPLFDVTQRGRQGQAPPVPGGLPPSPGIWGEPLPRGQSTRLDRLDPAGQNITPDLSTPLMKSLQQQMAAREAAPENSGFGDDESCYSVPVNIGGRLEERCVSHIPGNEALARDVAQGIRRPLTQEELDRSEAFLQRLARQPPTPEELDKFRASERQVDLLRQQENLWNQGPLREEIR